MSKYDFKKVRTTSKNDCDECCFAFLCLDVCKLPKGWHYENKYPNFKN